MSEALRRIKEALEDGGSEEEAAAVLRALGARSERQGGRAGGAEDATAAAWGLFGCALRGGVGLRAGGQGEGHEWWLSPTEDAGHARYAYRLRVSSTAHTALEAEWARCRWIGNECCARSKKAHTEDEKCGPARLDKMLTEARTVNAWLREGSSVPQQQIIRDFAKSRAKDLKDIKAGPPQRQRAGMPKYKKEHAADPSLNYTQRGFRLKDGRLHLAGGITVTVVWSRDCPRRHPRSASTATVSATGTPRLSWPRPPRRCPPPDGTSASTGA